MYTVTYRTVCYGWRVGIVHSIVIVTATAAPDCDFTLLYLTYLTLPYLPYTGGLCQVGPVERRGTEHSSSRATEQASNRATEQPSKQTAIGGRRATIVARRSLSAAGEGDGGRKAEESRNPIMLTYLP